MSAQTYEAIIKKLDAAHVEYQTSEHEPVHTSEDASRIRGVALESGAKAIVLCGSKTGTHYVCVIPANLKLDSKAVKNLVGEKVSFAQDVANVTDCVPGSVPPFGSVLGLATYVDARLAQNEIINFNAGELTRSVSMRYQDYLTIEQPKVVTIAVF